MMISERLNPKKEPLFQHAEVALFTAWQNGKLAGRISATVDHAWLERGTTPPGTSVTSTPSTTSRLRARWSIVRRMAAREGHEAHERSHVPRGQSGSGDLDRRARTSAHARYGAFPALSGGARGVGGAGREKDLYAYRYDTESEFNARTQRAWEHVQGLSEVRMRSLNLKRLRDEIGIVMEIYNETWAGKWGYVPLTSAELDKMASDMSLVIDPDLAFIAEVDGKPGGMCIAIPNLNEVIADLDGQPLPHGVGQAPVAHQGSASVLGTLDRARRARGLAKERQALRSALGCHVRGGCQARPRQGLRLGRALVDARGRRTDQPRHPLHGGARCTRSIGSTSATWDASRSAPSGARATRIPKSFLNAGELWKHVSQGCVASSRLNQRRFTMMKPTIFDIQAVSLLETMMRSRAFEECLIALQAAGKSAGTCTAVGQEASAVGVVSALASQDRILTNHRSAGHLMARGADPGRLFAEVLGRSGGYCRGKSGTLHISARELGVILTSTIVGGELSLATGVALSQTMVGTDDGIVVCFFGDGAACEGIFHESLNLATLWNLPILYVCENNQWQAYVQRRETMPMDHVSVWAAAHGMPTATVDGNDVEVVCRAAQEAADFVRTNRKPYFLETYTYRMRGHFEPDDMAYVPKDELESWRARDPIAQQRERVLSRGLVDAKQLAAMEELVNAEVQRGLAFAQSSPPPAVEELTTDVYA